jgi:hypothetical protein
MEMRSGRPYILHEEAAENHVMNVKILTDVLQVEVEGKPDFIGINGLDLPRHLRKSQNVIKVFPAFEKVKVFICLGNSGMNVVGTWSNKLAAECLIREYIQADAYILPTDTRNLPDLTGTTCPRIIGLFKELKEAFADLEKRNDTEAASAAANLTICTQANISQWETKSRKTRQELYDFFDAI